MSEPGIIARKIRTPPGDASNPSRPGICDLDDLTALAADIHEPGIPERFVGNHPCPANPTLTTYAMELDFDFLYLGIHWDDVVGFLALHPLDNDSTESG